MILVLVPTFCLAIAIFCLKDWAGGEDLRTVFWWLGVIVSGITLMTAGVDALQEHCNANIEIEINQIKMQELLNRMEFIDTEKENVSASDLIKDISEWNQRVAQRHYWQENPVTSWLLNPEITNSMQKIEMKVHSRRRGAS